MHAITYKDGAYGTAPQPVSLFAKLLPSFVFYVRLLATVFKASAKAKRSEYGNTDWVQSSLEVLRAAEGVGISVEITGIQHVQSLAEPCVFISNHMSTFETMTLPCIIQPFKDVTFVVKQSLVEYPVFKYVMRSRDPVTVTRTNSREDFKAVLDGGTERLSAGRSIVVFPQTTRSLALDTTRFNTIGVKLARRAGVPIVPIALLTDAWANGKWLKDFGRIDPSKEAHFAFGEPLRVQGHGREEHDAIIHFIRARLEEWRGGCNDE